MVRTFACITCDAFESSNIKVGVLTMEIILRSSFAKFVSYVGSDTGLALTQMPVRILMPVTHTIVHACFMFLFLLLCVGSYFC